MSRGLPVEAVHLEPPTSHQRLSARFAHGIQGEVRRAVSTIFVEKDELPIRHYEPALFEHIAVSHVGGDLHEDLLLGAGDAMQLFSHSEGHVLDERAGLVAACLRSDVVPGCCHQSPTAMISAASCCILTRS